MFGVGFAASMEPICGAKEITSTEAGTQVSFSVLWPSVLLSPFGDKRTLFLAAFCYLA
jgi:hypothetical protein